MFCILSVRGCIGLCGKGNGRSAISWSMRPGVFRLSFFGNVCVTLFLQGQSRFACQEQVLLQSVSFGFFQVCSSALVRRLNKESLPDSKSKKKLKKLFKKRRSNDSKFFRYGCNASQWAALAGSVEMCANHSWRVHLVWRFWNGLKESVWLRHLFAARRLE